MRYAFLRMGRSLSIALVVSAVLVSAQLAAAGPMRARVAATDFAGGARFSWLAKVELSRREYEAFAAQARDRLSPRIEKRGREKGPGERTTSRTDYMADETLRDGDIIVTEKGLIVFTGASCFQHSASDFKTINQWLGGVRYESELMEIERVNMSGER